MAAPRFRTERDKETERTSFFKMASWGFRHVLGLNQNCFQTCRLHVPGHCWKPSKEPNYFAICIISMIVNVIDCHRPFFWFEAAGDPAASCHLADNGSAIFCEVSSNGALDKQGVRVCLEA